MSVIHGPRFGSLSSRNEGVKIWGGRPGSPSGDQPGVEERREARKVKIGSGGKNRNRVAFYGPPGSISPAKRLRRTNRCRGADIVNILRLLTTDVIYVAIIFSGCEYRPSCLIFSSAPACTAAPERSPELLARFRRRSRSRRDGSAEAVPCGFRPPFIIRAEPPSPAIMCRIFFIYVFRFYPRNSLLSPPARESSLKRVSPRPGSRHPREELRPDSERHREFKSRPLFLREEFSAFSFLRIVNAREKETGRRRSLLPENGLPRRAGGEGCLVFRK